MDGVTRRRAAVAGALATALSGVAVFWLAVRLPALGAEDPLGSAATVPFVLGMTVLAATGAVVVRTRPRSAVGWLLLGTGLSGVLARLSLALAVLASARDHVLAAAMGWVTNWSWLPAQALAMLLILRFPDGTLPSPRWRWVQRSVLVWSAAALLVSAVVPGPLGAEQLAPRTNPVGLSVLAPVLETALSVLFVVQPVLLLLVVAAPVIRWRRAPSDQRRQLTAIAIALIVLALAAPLALATGAGEVLEGLAWLAVPLALAYAVTRLGLFDVDLRRRLDRLRAVREEERARLQRDLHDSLGPLLGSISMRVEAARNLVAAQASPSDLDQVLAAVEDDAESAVVEVRRFIDELRPTALADADLLAALRELVDDYADSELRVELHVPDHLPELTAEAEIALYRVAGEALRNVSRHARASRCRISLRAVGPDVVLDVVDDGVGLRGRRPGVGRTSMADRVTALGGTFELAEPASGGVHVSARLAEVVR